MLNIWSSTLSKGWSNLVINILYLQNDLTEGLFYISSIKDYKVCNNLTNNVLQTRLEEYTLNTSYTLYNKLLIDLSQCLNERSNK